MLCNNVKLLTRSDHSGWCSFIPRSKTWQPCIGAPRLFLKKVPDKGVQILSQCSEPENKKFSSVSIFFKGVLSCFPFYSINNFFSLQQEKMHATNIKAFVRLRNNPNKTQTRCKTQYFNSEKWLLDNGKLHLSCILDVRSLPYRSKLLITQCTFACTWKNQKSQHTVILEKIVAIIVQSGCILSTKTLLPLSE